MIVSNDDIKGLMYDICYDFSCGQYLKISGKHNFDDVSTRLKKLWYDYENEKLCIAALEIEYYRYLSGKYTAKQFYKRLKQLIRRFKYEFLKLKIKKHTLLLISKCKNYKGEKNYGT